MVDKKILDLINKDVNNQDYKTVLNIVCGVLLAENKTHEEIFNIISSCIDAINLINPHEVSRVKCDLCGFEWIAVRPAGLDKLECKQCGNIASFENI